MDHSTCFPQHLTSLGHRDASNETTRHLGAVLVTYKRPVELARSLEAFACQTVEPRHLVLVDNDNDPRVQSLLEKFSLRTGAAVTYLAPKVNLGPAGGFASGLGLLSKRLSGDDWVVLLDDDDPLVHPSTLQRLLVSRRNLVNSGIRLGGIGMKGARFDRRKLRSHSVASDDALIEVDHLHGGFAPIYRLQALWESGGFRPDLFWGFEELDVGLRITGAGWRLVADTETLYSSGGSPKLKALSDKPRWTTQGWSPRRYYTLRNLVVIAGEHCRRLDIAKMVFTRCLAKPLINFPIRPFSAVKELRCNLLALRHARRRTLGRTIEL
jgi:rhamnopyranosyl-N-acetylglucosaminyl-diphospho-decaprenol beta-1,3/1,4-galactofuranosyltransferase